MISRFVQQYGFNIPLLFKDKAGLGIRYCSESELLITDSTQKLFFQFFIFYS